MPRIVEHDAGEARRLDDAIAAIENGAPTNPQLMAKANAGTLRLNFAAVSVESGVPRHRFDKPGSLYDEQHHRIATLAAEKGKAEPLASQLAECRRKLDLASKRLILSQTYAANLLTLTRELEVEIKRLREIIAGRQDAGGEALVGSGALPDLPPPIKRRIGPGQGRRRAK